ncbi:hypothetical protein [Flavobacterium sp. CS20]|uniref:hypothetical protein n=1 Tax=Flavobacterium sp. CS20 TaxID=2775246 RepID=UPI001B39E9AD|nr:hypothetical protein [Flavobacterium sp. CS20]QTY26803.1 hypothetical protein IGB25_13140 [Flavobacterium sp. CS20]
MRKIIKIALFFVAFVAFVWLLNFLSNDRAIKQEIKQEFKGLIVGDTTFRRRSQPTHLIIKEKEEYLYITGTENLDKFYKIGDSIVKPANQNKLIIIRDGVKEEFIYRPNWKPNK